MAGGGRGERASRPRARAASVVVPFTRPRTGGRLDAAQLVPSGRSLALAFALLAGALAAWFLARETPVFALRELQVTGTRPGIARQVRTALRSELGTSLLQLDAARAERMVEALPTVLFATLDRAFPHALRVVVVPERAVAVVRQGDDSWLVSARGRVMGRIERGTKAPLPRIWIRRDVRIEVGAILGGDLAAAVTAVSPLVAARLPRVATVRTGPQELSLALRSGLLLRLGEPTNVRLKLAIAARILPLLGADTVYLDVSVPDRPVSGTSLKSQVEVESATSTTT